MLTDILDGVTPRRNERATSPLASVAVGDSTDKIAGKIQHAEKAKVLMMFVLGGRDMEAGLARSISTAKARKARNRRANAVMDILAAIKERRA